VITGADLENRQAGRRRPEPEPAPSPAPADLATRLAAARALRPPDLRHEHCGHCWGEGRDAALRAIEGAATRSIQTE
jgi:hypothetical protein